MSADSVPETPRPSGERDDEKVIICGDARLKAAECLEQLEEDRQMLMSAAKVMNGMAEYLLTMPAWVPRKTEAVTSALKFSIRLEELADRLRVAP